MVWLMMILVVPLLLCGNYVSAFPLSLRVRIHPLPRMLPASSSLVDRMNHHRRPSAGFWTTTLSSTGHHDRGKNVVDEILDALDTMLGVSPLAETDLKSPSSNETDFWERAQQRRALLDPPVDALQKPSVAIFFAFLAIVPAFLSIYAIQQLGVRPFGL
jgi:hypothetical protein